MDNCFCDISEKIINPAEIISSVARHSRAGNSHGAEVLFLGVVRDHNAGKDVKSVLYDAFIPLAKNILLEIATEARARFGQDLCLAVLHRIGELKVGEISVAICVSSPHRDEAYKASRYVIEEIKIRAPIWKKEFYIDGDSGWVRGHALCSAGGYDGVTEACDGRDHGGRQVHPHGTG
ncbi:MAG: molybdenum cofactor biosynthesis protein MoaE [Bdellovibrionota bacterium]